MPRETFATPIEEAEQAKARIAAKARLDPVTGCLVWTGTRSKRFGYGKIHFRGVMLEAHRLSYAAHVGPIPPGLHVCHRCDNPPCVNPDHLFAGSRSDNMRDMIAKGRRKPIPVGRGPAILKPAQVYAIRQLISEGQKDAEIAPRFGVKPRTIRAIRHKQLWAHLPPISSPNA